MAARELVVVTVSVIAMACGGGRGAAPRPASPLVQGAAVELAGLDVYGTSDALAAQIEARYRARLTEAVAAIFSDRPERSTAIRDEVVAGVRALGDFAYVGVSLVVGSLRDGKHTAHLVVDVVETRDRARRMPFGAAPVRALPDPDGLLAAWTTFEEAALRLAMAGRAGRPECPAFHCLIDARGTELEPLEQRFAREVPARRDALVEILHHSRDPDARSAAAFLLAYSGDGARLVAELVLAVRDPDAGVRNNALRVLMYIAASRPAVAVPLEPILEALDYPTLSDRNKAAWTLHGLAKARPDLRPAIGARAGSALLALLRTQAPQTHDPAFQILQLISGEGFGERDFAAWRAWIERGS